MSRHSRIALRLGSAPGSRYARRTLLPRVRANPTVRTLAKRILGLDAASNRATDLASGDLLVGLGTESVPVLVVVAFDTSPEILDTMVDEIARQQLLSAGFRPVFVLSSPDFHAPRRYGYVSEFVVPEKSWPHSDRPWREYVQERLAAIITRYNCTATLHAGPDGLTDTQRLLLSAMRCAT